MTGEEKDANGKVAKVTLPDGEEIELPLLYDASGARFLVSNTVVIGRLACKRSSSC